jgi:hypothetical protein
MWSAIDGSPQYVQHLLLHVLMATTAAEVRRCSHMIPVSLMHKVERARMCTEQF